jgi:ankyrin repeat protein
LLQAAKSRADGCLVLLLELAVNTKNTDLLNIYDNDGNTILHYVCMSMNKDLVKYLIDYGANMNIKNKDGKLPIDLCSGRLMKDIKDILDNHAVRTEHALSSSLSLSTNILTIDEILSPSKDNNGDTNYADLEVDLDINNVSLNFDLSINPNTPILSSSLTKQSNENHHHHWMNLMAATCRLYGRKRFESKFRVKIYNILLPLILY